MKREKIDGKFTNVNYRKKERTGPGGFCSFLVAVVVVVVQMQVLRVQMLVQVLVYKWCKLAVPDGFGCHRFPLRCHETQKLH